MRDHIHNVRDEPVAIPTREAPTLVRHRALPFGSQHFGNTIVPLQMASRYFLFALYSFIYVMTSSTATSMSWRKCCALRNDVFATSSRQR